jgi:excisionase family DNA binding protein
MATNKPEIERMLPIREVADLLSVHKRTIRREIDRGHLLPVVQVSGETRIPMSTISTYLRARTVRQVARNHA